MKTIYILVLAITPLLLQAQDKLRANKEESFIAYTMKHPMHEWTGTSKDLNCIMETDAKGVVQKVAAVVKLNTFDSKNSNRDSHLIEVTDGLTYPNISFVSTAVTAAGAGKYKVNGKISFHGVEKPTEFIMAEEVKGSKRTFTGSFQILIEDFKIERPSLMFVKTDNEVKIDLKVVF